MKSLFCLTLGLFSSDCYSLNSHLMQLVRCFDYDDSYDITILSFDPIKKLTEQEIFENLDCVDLQEKILIFSLDHLFVKKWSRILSRADVILCQHYVFSDILRSLKLSMPSVSIISWIHSIVLEEYLSGSIKFRNDAEPLIRLQEAQVSLSNICVFDSKYDESLGKRDFAKIRESRVIPLISEMTNYQDLLLSHRQSLHTKPNNINEIQLLFIGRVDYRKGIEAVVSCACRMFFEHNVKSGFLSEDGLESVLPDPATKKQFIALRDHGGLKCIPWITSKKEYAEYLSSGKWVAVLPSYYDPFNLAALDCAIMGLPMVVSNRCGVTEILKENKELIFVNPYNRENLFEKVLSVCEAAIHESPTHEIMYDTVRFKENVKKLFSQFH